VSTESPAGAETPADAGSRPEPDPQPSVSVVIATHNRPQLLRAAVQAVLTQDYVGSIEVVAVFDRAEPDEDLPGLAADGPGPRPGVRRASLDGAGPAFGPPRSDRPGRRGHPRQLRRGLRLAPASRQARPRVGGR